MKNSLPSRGGYTFIEILVVITIIAILTAVGATNFRVANQKARDGRRQADLEQIRAGLELYRADENIYPTTDIIAADEIVGTTGTVYMEDIPADPQQDYQYYYVSDGDSYNLCASMEVTEGGSCEPLGADCGVDSCNYQVTNPK